jgi:hypothetical protein
VTLPPLRDLAGPIGIAAAVLFAALFARSCNRAASAEAELKREREAGKLSDAGVPPEQEVDAKALHQRIEELTSENAVFKSVLDSALVKLRDATGKTPKVVEVVKWRTKPGGAQGAALSPVAPPAPGCPSEAPCLVRAGTPLAIEGIEGRLETKAGNRVVVGSASCIRLEPPPPISIFEGAFDLKLTEGVVVAPPHPPSSRPWIAGVVASTNGKGWGVGPTAGYAGSRVVLTLGGTFGSESHAIASAMWRF